MSSFVCLDFFLPSSLCKAEDERTVDRPSYNAVGRALKPSVASIPLFPGFPGLGGPREATPPRGGSVVSAEAKTRLPAISCTSVALSIG